MGYVPLGNDSRAMTIFAFITWGGTFAFIVGVGTAVLLGWL